MGAPADLIGRGAAWASLERAWDGAVGGQGFLIVIDGEAGLGKSHLARALGAHARRKGAAIWVGCAEQASPPPQGVLVRITGEVIDADVTVGNDAATGLASVADHLGSVLAERSAAHPLLVVVDDVHWADDASLRVLALLGPALEHLPVGVIATLRTGEPVAEERRSALGALARAAVRIPLTPLPDEEAVALAAAAAPAPLAPEVLDAVRVRASGNPLFLRELALVAARTTGDDAVHQLPETLRDVIERRLAVLDTDSRRRLEVLAVCGDDVPGAVAAAVLDESDLAGALGAAVEARVVEPIAAGRVRFSHPLVRDALVAGVPYPRRVGLHRDLASRLAVTAAGAGHVVDASLVATHACAAAPAGGAAEAVRWATEAAREATSRLAPASAAAWYRRALDALDLDPTAGDRLELLLDCAAALEEAGERRAAEEAYLAAAVAARAAEDVHGLAKAALGAVGGGGFEIEPVTAEQLDLLDAALRALPENALGPRAMVLARRSIAAWHLEPPDRRQAAAERALDLAEATGDPAATCDALASVCDAVAGPADAERRVALATRMLAIATEADDPKRHLLALRLLAVAHLERGDALAFDEVVERYEHEVGRIRLPLYEWCVPLWRGLRAAMAGHTDTAYGLADHAEAIGIAGDSANAVLLARVLRFCLDHALGEGPTEEQMGAEAAAMMISPWMATSRAYTAAGRGELEAARRELDALPGALAQLPVDSEYLPALVQAAFAVAAVGGHEVGALLYDRLLPHRHRFAVEGIGAYCHGSVERFLGLLADSMGRPEAPEHHAAARRANRAAGAWFLAPGDEEPSPASRVGSAAPVGTFRRDGDVWLVGIDGREGHIRDSKGMVDLARLLAHPREPVPATELAGRRLAGGTGRGEEVLDRQALAAYKDRLADLDDEIDDADRSNDPVRRERASVERDFLIAELSRAAGLGRRRRRMGDDVERARTAVTARIRDAIRRLEAIDADLADHLSRSVRTGTACVYDPEREIDWKR